MGAPAVMLLVLAVAATVTAAVLWRSRATARREARELRGALLASQPAVVAGRLAPSLAHDLGNQMIVLQMKLREMRRGDAADCAAHLPGLGEAADAIQDLTRDLGSLAAPAEPGPERRADLRDVVEDAVAFARKHTLVRHASIEIEAGAAAPARVQPALARALLFHLLLGAAEAAEGDCKVAIRIAPAAGGWAVRVEDAGPRRSPAADDPSGWAVLRACAAAQGADVGPVPSRLGGAGFEIRFASESSQEVL